MSRAPRVREAKDVDEYIASWHATMQLLREGQSFSGRERNCAFLNRGDARFANVSSIAGFDFLDDGRAIGSVDWDHDGDLDLWVQNRTGPRLRFLRNQSRETTAGDFLAIRLRGVTCNRDAIGARVEVHLEGGTAKPLIQTVYAGDGYLSQSSKWLHFGLPAGASIRTVRVRWPGGEWEEFSTLAPGNHYWLEQQRGVAQVWERPTRANLQPQPQLAVENASTIRAAFASPVTLPLLSMKPTAGATSEALVDPHDRPLLVLLWASWCPNCLEELQRLSDARDTLSAAKLDVLALNVDHLAMVADAGTEGAADVLKRLKFPYATGYATAALMDKLQIVQRVVLNRPLPSAIPMAMLVTPHRELAAIYQGVQPIETFLNDARLLDADPRERREKAIPFAGTWTTTPGELLLRPVANVFREAGYRDDYEYYLRVDRDRLQQWQQMAADDPVRRALELRYANDSLDLGLSLLESGQPEAAIDYFREGLARVPDSAAGHFQWGRAWLALGKTREAIAEWQATLNIDPVHVPAHFQLGLVAASEKQVDEATRHFQTVVEHQPNHAEAWTNLGVILARTRQAQAAIDALRKAIAIDPQQVQALLFLGGQLASRGEFAEAADCFRRVTELQPDAAQAFAALGQTQVKLRHDAEAVAAFQQAIAHNRRDASSKLQLAWLQATSPIDAVRNGASALDLATELAEQTERRDPRVLDALAAAHAEQRQFAAALEAIHAAQALLPPNHVLQKTLRERLMLYQKDQPFRERFNPAPAN